MESPKIRFKGYTEDWEQRKLGDVVDVCSGRDYKHLDEGDVPVYGTGGYMLSVSDALSEKEDAIGIGRKGTIDNPYILRAPFWTVDTLFYCIPKENYNLDFIFSIYQNINWKAMDESTGVPSLSKTVINNVDIMTPPKAEQIKIGECFRNLDKIITLHQRKCEETKKLKKYMLQKMFPQNGKNIPEIRFEGFTGAWEQRKLDDVLEVLKDGTHGTHADVDNGVYLLSAKNIKNGCVSIDESDRQISFEEYEKIHTKFKLKNGDVLMTIVGTIGEAAILESAENITFQRSVAFLRPSNELLNSFLLQTIYTKSFQKELDNRKATGAQPGIYLGEVAQIPIMIPTNLSEQEKISSYFDNLDNLITLHQRKCDELKTLKKYMLQNMFV